MLSHLKLNAIVFSLSMTAIASCSHVAGSSGSSVMATGVSASHCELFVDKVLATRPNSSHAPTYMKLYVKTLNSRLDAPIAEVGFHNKIESLGERSTNGTFADVKLIPFLGNADYWEFTATIHDGIEPHFASYEGAFYVQTTNGTRYWQNTSAGGNFVIDMNAYNNTVNEMHVTRPDGAAIDLAVPTQGTFGGYYNAGGCR